MNYYWDRYFSGWKGENAIGDARTRNLYLPFIPERIKRSTTDQRFIIILRNPVQRAFSHWLWRYRLGLEVLPSEDAIYEDLRQIEKGITFDGEEGARLWHPLKFRTYLDSGCYSEQIRRYMELFPVDRIRIVFLEDLSRNPQKVISELWAFLGVDSELKLVDTQPKNESPSLFAAKMHLRASRAIALLPARVRLKTRYRKYIKPRRALMSFLEKVGHLSHSVLDTFGSRLHLVSPSLEEFLKGYYYRYNRDLETIVKRDLSHWDE